MTEAATSSAYPYRRADDQMRAEPARHPIVVVGAGPVGLVAAIDLARQGFPVVILDENDSVSHGSRAICYAKRLLDILDRLGCGEEIADRGVRWNVGKVFVGPKQIYRFDLLAEQHHRRPAFVNLQQYHFEALLVAHINQLRETGRQIDLRGCHQLVSIQDGADAAVLTIETPDGPYQIAADWVLACDGANSTIRDALNQRFIGRVFEDNFLIADVVMRADFPPERWFWFDPPFNPGQSALLHKQPDNVWRIDLQLGHDVDKEAERSPDKVIPRLKAMLGDDAEFELEWVSVYSFQCRRMERFRHGRVLFAGDAAHQLSPFGARGANSGVQDVDNLCWKLGLVLCGQAPESLLDSYETERILAADENILNSTRATDFITPKSPVSRLFRDAALTLAEHFEFARPLINSGRLSTPCWYDGSPLNGEDALPLAPAITRPGAPCPDARLKDGFLLSLLGDVFCLLAINLAVPRQQIVDNLEINRLILTSSDDYGELCARYLGKEQTALYLIRPDQHVVARWPNFDLTRVQHALWRALGGGR